MHQLVLLFTAILATMLGALPFGLVNLSVLDVSLQNGRKNAMQIAHGAAMVEVLFGITSILVGKTVSGFIQGNVVLEYLIIAIILFAGLLFLLRKKGGNTTVNSGFSGFLKGVFLNLISIQVFMYWLIAITFLYSKNLLDSQYLSILIFALGIWLGKMIVLWTYSILSERIVSKSALLSRNINQIIGGILIFIATIQLFNY